jgi:hypothetical protein
MSKTKGHTVHPLNLLHSRLWLCSDFSYSYNFSDISTFLTGQTILISHFIQLHELPEISFHLQYFLSLGNTYRSFTAKNSEQVGGEPAEFDLHNNSNRDEDPVLRWQHFVEVIYTMLSHKKTIYCRVVRGQEFLHGASCLKKQWCEPQIFLSFSSIPCPELCLAAIFLMRYKSEQPFNKSCVFRILPCK